MALEAQNNPFTSVLMVEAADVEALPDADPAAGQRRLAVGTDHLLYLVSNAGVKTLVGGAGIANPLATDSLWDAAGDLVQGSGANTAAKLSAGTAGKVLTSNGAAAALTWETPSAGAAGALVFLEAHTASNSSSLDFTAFISSTYDDYWFEFVDIFPATDAVNFLMIYATGGGPTYDTGTNYAIAVSGQTQSGAVIDAGGGKSSNFLNGSAQQLSNSASWGYSGSLKLFGAQSGVYKKMVGSGGYLSSISSGVVCVTTFMGSNYSLTAALTAIRFKMSSGNITSGTIRVYGVSKT